MVLIHSCSRNSILPPPSGCNCLRPIVISCGRSFKREGTRGRESKSRIYDVFGLSCVVLIDVSKEKKKTGQTKEICPSFPPAFHVALAAATRGPSEEGRSLPPFCRPFAHPLRQKKRPSALISCQFFRFSLDSINLRQLFPFDPMKTTHSSRSFEKTPSF